MKKFSLARNERVKKKKDFECVFSSGKVIYCADLLIKSIFVFDINSKLGGVKIAAAVSKKAGTAVWRNRVKRLIKESYRLNKHLILDKAQEKNIMVRIIFSTNKLSQAKNNKLRLKDISPCLVELLNKISQQIC